MHEISHHKIKITDTELCNINLWICPVIIGQQCHLWLRTVSNINKHNKEAGRVSQTNPNISIYGTGHNKLHLTGDRCRTGAHVLTALCHHSLLQRGDLPLKPHSVVLLDRVRELLPGGEERLRPTGLLRHVHLGDVDPHVLPPVRELFPHRLELLAGGAPRSVAGR